MFVSMLQQLQVLAYRNKTLDAAGMPMYVDDDVDSCRGIVELTHACSSAGIKFSCIV